MAKVRRKVEILENDEKTLGGLPCKIEWVKKASLSAIVHHGNRICHDDGNWQRRYNNFATGLQPAKHKGSMYQMTDWFEEIGSVHSPGRDFKLADLFDTSTKISEMVSKQIGKIFLTTEKTFLVGIDANELTDKMKIELKKCGWRLSLMLASSPRKWQPHYWQTFTIHEIDEHQGYGWRQWHWDFDPEWSQNYCIAEYRKQWFYMDRYQWTHRRRFAPAGEERNGRIDELSEEEQKDAHYGWIRWMMKEQKLFD